MEDSEKELLKIGAEAALKPFSSLLERLLGGLVDQTGGQWEDAAKVRRLRRQIKLYAKVQELLEDAGIEPRQVSDKIGFPLLSAASLEDDPDIQDTWAAMLANAADPREASKVEALFVAMLREMTPAAVKFLDALFPANPRDYATVNSSVEPLFHGAVRQVVLPPPRLDEAGKAVTPPPRAILSFKKSGLLNAYVRAGLARRPELAMISMGDWKKHGDELRLDHEDCQYLIDLLKRNAILTESLTTPTVDITPLSPAPGNRSSPQQKAKIQQVAVYSLTQLGISFIRACRPPRPEKRPTP